MQNYLCQARLAIDFFTVMMDYLTILSIFAIELINNRLRPMLKIKEGFRGEKSYILQPAALALMEEHPLSAILHITDIGYYPRAANHYRERFTPLKVNVFIYCVAGEGWYYVDGHRYQVGPDTFFILPAGLPHSYGASDDNPWTIYWIHFGGTLASEYMPESPSPIEIKPGQSSRIASRIDIFEEIMATLDIALDREHLLYACSVFHHFIGSLRFFLKYRSAGEIAYGNDVISRHRIPPSYTIAGSLSPS